MIGGAGCFMAGGTECFAAGDAEHCVTGGAECFVAGGAECLWAHSSLFILSVAIPIFLVFFLILANGALQSP